YSLADSFVYMLLFFLICHRFGPTLFPYTTLFRSSRPWSRCSRRSRRGCRSTPATCSSPRHLGRPLQACPCGLLPSRFSYRHSAWRARVYVPMSDGTRHDEHDCGVRAPSTNRGVPRRPPPHDRRCGGRGLSSIRDLVGESSMRREEWAFSRSAWGSPEASACAIGAAAWFHLRQCGHFGIPAPLHVSTSAATQRTEAKRA